MWSLKFDSNINKDSNNSTSAKYYFKDFMYIYSYNPQNYPHEIVIIFFI